ncbi:nitrilase-related carbon-nitrogen hydrolase [Sciscionella marina]|uniref:nitrilase-related carbon-nitrogen hydrolase n=1 Tax=Sciscionella marina TaxID=508770 RepID=UPI0003814B8C|nr:nitrilase-related carbon-nitrogen hydrolase [Sciscionella marina]
MAINVAVTQMSCTDRQSENLDRAERLIRYAAAHGAQLVLLQELFAGPYFCQQQDPVHLARACEADRSPVLTRMRSLAAELGVVLPVSFYERTPNALFNSVAMIDADGSLLGVYRKSHIPDDPGYFEKFYFSEGDTGLLVWHTAVGRIGAGVCWDQWFPEAARVLTLRGADLLLYPTAIGSDPLYPGGTPMPQWRRCMQGHAAANFIPVLASNRTGTESIVDGCSLEFLGNSFIADHHGEILAEAGEHGEEVLVARLNLERAREERYMWGLFADRRPELYTALTAR